MRKLATLTRISAQLGPATTHHRPAKKTGWEDSVNRETVANRRIIPARRASEWILRSAFRSKQNYKSVLIHTADELNA